MIVGKFLKFICVTLIFEFAASQWDDSFCDNLPDLQYVPHPNGNCQEYMICFQGLLYEEICPEGELFDPFQTACVDAAEANCDEDIIIVTEPPDDSEWNGCPPPGSFELVYFTATNCNEYYICINGERILLACGPGLHWNHDDIDPSRGWYRFKKFQQCDW